MPQALPQLHRIVKLGQYTLILGVFPYLLNCFFDRILRIRIIIIKLRLFGIPRYNKASRNHNNYNCLQRNRPSILLFCLLNIIYHTI